MLLRILDQKPGRHPSERLVSVPVVDGVEHLVVDQHSIVNGYLKLASLVAQHDDQYLVEFSRETENGAWRSYVHARDLWQIEAAGCA